MWFKVKAACYIFILINLLGCASNKQMRSLESQLNCNKTVHFIWDNSSDFVEIESKGIYKGDYISFSNGKRPNYKKTFMKSLDKLNKKHVTKLVLKEAHGFPLDSVIQVTVKIDEIIWNKGFSSMIMDAYLVYEISNQDVQIVGQSNSKAWGRDEDALLQCFEHGNLQFLLSYCNE